MLYATENGRISLQRGYYWRGMALVLGERERPPLAGSRGTLHYGSDRRRRRSEPFLSIGLRMDQGDFFPDGRPPVHALVVLCGIAEAAQFYANGGRLLTPESQWCPATWEGSTLDYAFEQIGDSVYPILEDAFRIALDAYSGRAPIVRSTWPGPGWSPSNTDIGAWVPGSGWSPGQPRTPEEELGSAALAPAGVMAVPHGA